MVSLSTMPLRDLGFKILNPPHFYIILHFRIHSLFAKNKNV